MKSKQEQINELVIQLIGMAEAKDRWDKKADPLLHGESSVTFHLKALKELIDSLG